VIKVNGSEARLADPKHAQRLGISTVFQDLALVNQRDVARNLFLGQETSKLGFMMDREQVLARSAHLLRHLGVKLPSVRRARSRASPRPQAHTGLRGSRGGVASLP